MLQFGALYKVILLDLYDAFVCCVKCGHNKQGKLMHLPDLAEEPSFVSVNVQISVSETQPASHVRLRKLICKLTELSYSFVEGTGKGGS